MTTAKQNKTIDKVPLFVFIATFAIGLLILFFSINSQLLIPEIFEGEPYPSQGPGGGCNSDSDCSGGDICVDFGGGTRACHNPQSDPWCNPPDDDDDPSPTPPPSDEPTPPPSDEPTPPPSNYECTGLSPQPDNPQRGDTVAFTCTSSATDVTINHYNFRVNGAGTERVDTSAAQATYSFTIPESGNEFNVQCQVCIDETTCTAWGQAN